MRWPKPSWGEADDAIAALDEAERDALAASGLDVTVAEPADADAAAVQELANLLHGERSARIGSILTGRIERILVAVEAGRAVETRYVLALNALVQLAERITNMTPEDRREAAIKSDAEVAEIYERLARRIEQRAAYYCRQFLRHRFRLSGEQLDELMATGVDGPRYLVTMTLDENQKPPFPHWGEQGAAPPLTLSLDAISTTSA